MHSNLKHLVKHYSHPAQDGQFPVSKTDAEIIEEIKIAVGLLNRSTPLVAILDGYKTKLPDAEILAKIEEFTLALETNEVDDDGEPTRDFVRFENQTFLVSLVMTVSAEEVWEDKSERETFLIIINQQPDLASKLPPLANLTFVYYNEEIRDEKLQYLHQTLENKTNIRFL